jgi:hypothetical protein
VCGIDTGDVHATIDEVADESGVGRALLGQRDHDPGPPLGSFRTQEQGRTLCDEPRLGITKPANPGDPREGCGVTEECAERGLDDSDAGTNVGLSATERRETKNTEVVLNVPDVVMPEGEIRSQVSGAAGVGRSDQSRSPCRQPGALAAANIDPERFQPLLEPTDLQRSNGSGHNA